MGIAEDVPSKTKIALLAAFVCFLSVDVFIAASVGLSEWFYSATSVRFRPTTGLNYPNILATITDVVERRIGVNGRVVESLQSVYDLGPIDNENFKYGSFQCTFKADWNYWLQDKELGCSNDVDGQLDDGLKEMAAFICKRSCDYQLQQYQNAYPACKDLEAGADIGDDFFVWLERAVCSGAKGVMSMLVLSMFCATVGMFMCYFVRHKPQLIMIPGLIIVLLTAIAVVAYGASISSTYPFTYRDREDLVISEYPQVDGAQSNAANVQIGFGLAIAAAVLSLLSVTLAYVGRYLPSDGTELQVISALPIQIYGSTQGEGNGASLPPGIIQARTMPLNTTDSPQPTMTIASASVVTTPDHGNAATADATPFGTSRVVAVSQSPRARQLTYPGDEAPITPGAGESSLAGSQGVLVPTMVAYTGGATPSDQATPGAPFSL